MGSRVLVAGVLAILAVIAGATYYFAGNGFGSKSDDALEFGQNDARSVSIEGKAFVPAELTVQAGTTVVWTNRGAEQCNVVAEDKLNGPSGPLLAQGEGYAYTFAAPGTYAYACESYPEAQGAVTVTE